MKTRKDYDFYLKRAICDFKALVIYFDVIRPQRENYYRVDGKFSIEQMEKEFSFLSDWKKKDADFKKMNSKKYSEYSMNFNYCFGIPSRLVEKVLGFYRDENGKKIRISIDEVLKGCPNIERLRHGTKTKKGEEGKYEVKCYWLDKYLLPINQWHMLLEKMKINDICELKNASSRAIKIICEFQKEERKAILEKSNENHNENTTKSEEKKDEQQPNGVKLEVKKSQDTIDNSTRELDTKLLLAFVRWGFVDKVSAKILASRNQLQTNNIDTINVIHLDGDENELKKQILSRFPESDFKKKIESYF